MTESTKKLIIFACIFVVVGLGIFALTSGNSKIKPPAEAATESTEIGAAAVKQAMQEIESLKASLKANPNNARHLAQIGNQYFDINMPKEAIEYYEKSLGITPDDPLVLTDCGIMYNQLGRPEKALEYFEKAIKLRPDLPQAYFNKGLVLLTTTEDRANAIIAWREFIKLTPDTIQANLVKKEIEILQRDN